MIRAADSLGRRAAGAGFGVRPAALRSMLAIIAVWFVAELLLAARFWIQLTATDVSAGFNNAVLDLTRPLVLPFEDVQQASERTTGTFEYGTVMAAEVFLVIAIVLVVAIFLLSNIVAIGQTFSPRTLPRGRVGLAEDQTGPLASRAARLRNTFFLALPPDAAQDKLRNLRLDRFSLEIVTIPAAGGCVIAVFSPVEDENARVPLLSRIRQAREEHDVSRLLKSIGGTLAMPSPAPGG